MRKLGISIYPEHSTPEKDYEYMKLASSYGFKRIFTCLLSVDKPKEEIMEEFGDFMKKAHELGFEVSIDTAPYVFTHLGAKPDDLKVFHDLQVDIIRLDGHFDDYLDRLITHNPYGIKIEFNGSSDTNVEGLLRHGADIHNMCVCHNFYPERYSGLGWNTFMNFSKKYKDLGLHLAAFVSSNNTNTYGPWPVYKGLPTVELHRGKPIDVQIRHFLSCELIDDILIGNAYATEEELRTMANVDYTKTTISVDAVEGMNDLEKEILYEIDHAGRTDSSDYYIRSSVTRSYCVGKDIPARTCDQKIFKRGDVVIVNNNLRHYLGECQIILCDIENDGERNLVGRIPEVEMMILDQMELHPDHMFGFLK